MREARPQLEGTTLILRFPETMAFHQRKAEGQKEALLPLARAQFGVEELAFLLEKKTPNGANPSQAPAKPTPGSPPLNPPWEPVGIPGAEPEEAPGVGEVGRGEDPSQELARLARILGARLLWVKGPKALEAEEPVSEKDIGGTRI